MKRISFIAAITFLSFAAQAQQPVVYNDPYPKTITVSGSAEMEVIPDQIYVNIELREYQKRGEAKKELEPIKEQFLQSCSQLGIADSNISIVSYTGFNNYYWMRKRKRDPNLFASITYQVKFSGSKEMDALVEKLDDEATVNFLITKSSHSRMTEFRRQLKIQAVKAAKEKASYLTEAINEKLGEAITIKEPEERDSDINKINNSNGISNAAFYRAKALYDDAGDNDKVQEVRFRKIKLRYEVDIVFSLK